MKQVRVGTTTFAAISLRGITLTQAYEAFPGKDKRKVKAAWQIVNPEKEKKEKVEKPETGPDPEPEKEKK